MEKKKIIVKNKEFEFFFQEEINMWRTIENANLVEGHSIDMEIDLGVLKGDLDWLEVTRFIELIKNNNTVILEHIYDAKKVLNALFQSINKQSYTDDFFTDVDFDLSGIDFRGNCIVANMEKNFEYDCFFFPRYTKDPYKDIGSFVWRANFRDTLLLGVYCDRI